jgi:hypothetical protein
VPLIDFGVDFKVYVDKIMMMLKPWLQKVLNSTSEKTKVLPVASFFETRVKITTKWDL